ncbi:MAG: archaetidylserine decarboxylase [Acidobacteriota bacterium]
MNSLIRSLLYIISFPVFSRIYGRLTRIKSPKFFARFIIDFFVNTYDISMENYEGETGDYDSLSSIFIRKLDPEKRSLIPDQKHLLSPADGVVSSMELTDSDNVIQAKGIDYSLSEFLNADLDFSKKWYVTTIYLSPRDYHRYHFPVKGEVTGYCHMKGHIYPVNNLGLKNIKKLFIRNERIVLKMRSGKDPVYIAAVGATFVGSIKMEFIKKYKRDNKWKDISHSASQMDEMGRFELGSTIIMVTPEELAEPVEGITGNHIRTGEKLFRLKK